MNCCKSNQCIGIEETFDTEMARSDLEGYLENGPSSQTSQLLDAIKELGIEGATLMDIGGGIGVIQHEAQKLHVSHIVNVDASPAYSQVAREEAQRRGYQDRAAYYIGDFVTVAPTLDPVDFVTMDRVICCYDDMPALVRAATGKAKRALAIVYPVDRWFIRLGIRIANIVQAVLRHPFRIFAHRNAAVEHLIEAAGFRRRYYRRGLFWQVAVYAK